MKLKELQEKLGLLNDQRSAEMLKINNAATNEELDKIEMNLRKVDLQIAEVQKQIAELREADAEPNGQGTGVPEKESDPAQRQDAPVTEQRNLSPVASFRMQANQGTNPDEDIYASTEYRMAFKDYVMAGKPIPEKFKTESRSAELTVVGDVAAVIPTTISNKVIEDLTTEGEILNKISQTSFKGAVRIPIAEVNPSATWLESENVVSEEQKAAMKTYIEFKYYVLEARVAIGLLTATVSLPVFEQTVIRNLKKAMIRALESAVISGTGVGQPKGFLTYTLPAAQKISFTDAQIDSVKGWARAEAALPAEYENGTIYIMSKQTWEMHLNSMVDTTGQKIGLGKINEKGQRILNGRPVMLSDKMANYDTAQAGDIFGCLIRLSDYCLNSNLNMYYKKYFDEDKNKWIHKSLLIADGQMPIGEDSNHVLRGAKGLIYLTKAATVSEETSGSGSESGSESDSESNGETSGETTP